MLALLIHAAPLSGKCKHSSKLENGVHATLVPVQPLTLDNSPSTVSAASSSQSELTSSQIIKMTSSAVVPAAFSKDHTATLQLDKTLAVSDRTIGTTGDLDRVLGYSSPQDLSSGSDTLKWCEARRIDSEPVGLQSWPSDGSLEPDVPAEDDDVFTERDFSSEDGEDLWSVYPEDESFGEAIIIVEYYTDM